LDFAEKESAKWFVGKVKISKDDKFSKKKLAL